ncbi:hypothetical protein J6590_028262 [Homalodisca vitripennis]|nr:hypothetical protein J6590_028262 [Homalodisca vitripennis]
MDDWIHRSFYGVWGSLRRMLAVVVASAVMTKEELNKLKKREPEKAFSRSRKMVTTQHGFRRGSQPLVPSKTW